MTQERLSRLEAQMQAHRLDALALNPGSSLVYLTGLQFHLMERPYVFLLRKGLQPALIFAELEKLKANESTIPLQPFTYSDNPESWQAAFNQAITALQLNGTPIGVESTHMRFLELSYLQKAANSSSFVSADEVLNGLRICKDQSEKEKIQKAIRIAEKALLATLPMIKPSITELEIASELTIQLLNAGSDSALPFQPIVSSGPNSANPHAVPSDRKLQIGDMLVIDWGAAYSGYISDLTRTFAIGKTDPEFVKIAQIVANANIAARKLAKLGELSGNVDIAAREVIEKAGYGEYFTHRTGHGIGMESHEPPYIFKENTLKLQKGMCFTVEPGIYLPGRGGVRIEDNVIVTDTGIETLSNLPRELQILG
jgi:Xaa-Pro dipeptidase